MHRDLQQVACTAIAFKRYLAQEPSATEKTAAAAAAGSNTHQPDLLVDGA